MKTYIKIFKGDNAAEQANDWSEKYCEQIISASWAVRTEQYEISRYNTFITPIKEEKVLTVVFKSLF